MLAAGVEAQLCAHAARISAKESVRHRDETPSASPRAAHRHSATPPAVHTETRARPGAAAEFVLNLCASYEPVAVVRSKPHYWGQGMVRHVFPTVVGDTWADARRAGSLPRGSAVHVACHLPTCTIRRTRQRDATQRGNATQPTHKCHVALGAAHSLSRLRFRMGSSRTPIAFGRVLHCAGERAVSPRWSQHRSARAAAP